MTVQETLRGLLRRWYVAIPGLLLAVGLVGWTWQTVPPSYERTAREVLVPGEAALPVEQGARASDPNPFLYLSGLDSATDVLVSAVSAESVVGEVTEPYPGSEVEVIRDPNSAGPVVIITVNAPTDAEAEAILAEMLIRTSDTLEELQQIENVDEDARVTISPIAVDTVGTPQQADRLLLAGVAGMGTLGFTLLIAAGVDGLARRPRHRDNEVTETNETPSGPRKGTAPVGVEPGTDTGDGFHVEIIRMLDAAVPADAHNREQR